MEQVTDLLGNPITIGSIVAASVGKRGSGSKLVRGIVSRVTPNRVHLSTISYGYSNRICKGYTSKYVSTNKCNDVLVLTNDMSAAFPDLVIETKLVTKFSKK